MKMYLMVLGLFAPLSMATLSGNHLFSYFGSHHVSFSRKMAWPVTAETANMIDRILYASGGEASIPHRPSSSDGHSQGELQG